MLNTYIKNVGSTQTIIGNRCQNRVEEIDWNADYDGDRAKILIKTNYDGDKEKYHFTLDNTDLANLFNIDSVNMPIHKRLKDDFKKPVYKPKIYRIELPAPPRQPSYFSEPSISDEPESFSEFSTTSPSSFLPSPSTGDEFIAPITINPGPYKKYKFTPKKRNLTLKTHKTYRIYKRPKSYRSSTFKKGGANSTCKKRSKR
jgi:hypothetical protein